VIPVFTDLAVTYLWQHGSYRVVGMLEISQTKEETASRFVYDEGYLNDTDAIAIDPLGLPLMSEIQETGGLFSVFNDACPDSWGKHLLDIEAEGHETQPKLFDYLTSQDLDNRIGALAFGLNRSGPQRFDPPWRREVIPGAPLNLDEMIKAVDAVLDNDALPEQYRRFLVRGSSVGGAQPKAVVDYQGAPHIAKFSRDMEYVPVCRIERAAMRLAARCKIRVPECTVIEIGGRDVFLIERFDRTAAGGRRHLITAQTLIGSDDMMKGSYGAIADHMRRFCSHQHLQADLEELFRRMVFNILVNNHDDHLKNHAFIYDEASRGYRLSPAYDIVPRPPIQMDGEAERLSLGVGERGKRATIENALSGYRSFGLSRSQAHRIVDSMTRIVSRSWVMENKRAGISEKEIQKIKPSYRKNLHHSERSR
jgi:serine/threonine-protein kinase HipA